MFLMVKTCMERKYHPCIVFSFSKRDCEGYAMQMSKLDFNSRALMALLRVMVFVSSRFFFSPPAEEEKAAVEMVFTNAIEALSEEDRQLPQVRSAEK